MLFVNPEVFVCLPSSSKYQTRVERAAVDLSKIEMSQIFLTFLCCRFLSFKTLNATIKWKPLIFEFTLHKYYSMEEFFNLWVTFQRDFQVANLI